MNESPDTGPDPTRPEPEDQQEVEPSDERTEDVPTEDDAAQGASSRTVKAFRASDITSGHDLNKWATTLSGLVAESGALNQFTGIQSVVAKSLAESGALNQFTGIQSVVAKSLAESGALNQFTGIQSVVAKLVNESSAFKTFGRSAALDALIRTQAVRPNLLTTGAHAAIRTVLESQTSGLRKSALAIAKSFRLIYPANLRDIENLSFEDIEKVVMEDGIPLHGIPRKRTAIALLNAGSSQERRDILGRRWRTITDDCEAYLQRRLSPELDVERRFALEAVATVRAGHSASAQALASNLLDTLITRHFGEERIILRPSKKVKTPDGYSDFVLRKYWALAPIWSAYQHFHPDSVPRRFGRHPSTHAVVPVQYSRRNAVHAVMLVSSLIGYLDEVKSGTRA